MTHEQYGKPAHTPAINDPSRPVDADHNALVEEKTTMSSYGHLENYLASEHRLSGDWIVQDDGSDPDSDAAVMARPDVTAHSQQLPSRFKDLNSNSNDNPRLRKRARINFYEFAAQARLQQHHERRKHHLLARKRVLQKSIALSARLRRTTAWVQDGLVEISKHQNTAAFAQVYSHAQDLVDVCLSHWNNELNSLDIARAIPSEAPETSVSRPFFEALPHEAQNDLLELLSNLRCNPQFLVDRLRNLPRAQVATLMSNPRWQFTDTIFQSFSQDSNRSGSQRRRQLQTYSKELEEYATSLERLNPLSFLIHNLYCVDVHPESPESLLRLDTWSTICSQLFRFGSGSYVSLCGQALDAFAVTDTWLAKPRIELFLMDVLQKGAFLVNDNLGPRGQTGYNPLNTREARRFCEEQVLELYWTLVECGSGCFPSGALALAQAILGKLPVEADQSQFRMHFFKEWFLDHFLRAAIMFPENENMLLRMHVSKRARENILAPIYNMFLAKFDMHQNAVTEEDISIRNMIESMIGLLDGVHITMPYQKSSGAEQSTRTIVDNTSTLSISASEIIKILETLSPQTLHGSESSDPFIRDTSQAFRSTYSRPTTRFELLRQQLQLQMEAGRSAKDIHPCSEAWTQFTISTDGSVRKLEQIGANRALSETLRDCKLSLAQDAALRLCQSSMDTQGDNQEVITNKWSTETTLAELFREQVTRSQAETRTIDAHYWKKAYANLVRLNKLYSVADSLDDDTQILRQPLQKLSKEKQTAISLCDELEEQLGPYEAAYQGLKRQIKAFMSGLEELRLKLWYTAEVVNSSPYQNARNIAAALSQMAIPMMQATTQLDSQVRPGTSRSSRSSIFGEPQSDTMQLLKAPTEYGGPRKLADEQIESVNSWLKQQAIDNFCTGEERLHRFCMEIQLITKRLTGDTILQSPELWSSDLFSGESFSYGIHSVNISSAPASTRPASVRSDSLSATFPGLRPPIRSSESDSRSVMSDGRSSNGRGSVYQLFQQRLDPRLLTPSLASSFGSYGRNSSANTTTSEIFTPSQSSVTTQSVYSRPPSILQGGLPNFGVRPALSEKEKKRFREQLRKGLVCLLLSDLGSLAWSRGCETDAWIQRMQADPAVDARCQKRLYTNTQLSFDTKANSGTTKRRQSLTDTTTSAHSESGNDTVDEVVDREEPDIHGAIVDVLVRLSKQVDPALKLQACSDLHALAIEQVKVENDIQPAQHIVRRRSVNAIDQKMENEVLRATGRLSLDDSLKPAESRVVEYLKRQLAAIKPLTIFRDLQFIASFTPSEMLDRKAFGEAFMSVGMAAIGYKKEFCNSMVDVAHQLMTANHGENSPLSVVGSVTRAAELWKIAAREGNAVAQRELALLYLMRPELLSIVTMPLHTTGDIFRDEMMWQPKLHTNDNRQALCLALHWMQTAANNNDREAQQKLQERNGSRGSVQ